MSTAIWSHLSRKWTLWNLFIKPLKRPRVIQENNAELWQHQTLEWKSARWKEANRRCQVLTRPRRNVSMWHLDTLLFCKLNIVNGNKSQLHTNKLNVLKIFFWTPSADVIHEKINKGGGCIFRGLLKYIKWHPPFWLPGSKVKEHPANTNLIRLCQLLWQQRSKWKRAYSTITFITANLHWGRGWMTSAFLLFSRARGRIYLYMVLQWRERTDKLVSSTAAPSLGSHSKLSANQRFTRLNNTAAARLWCTERTWRWCEISTTYLDAITNKTRGRSLYNDSNYLHVLTLKHQLA